MRVWMELSKTYDRTFFAVYFFHRKRFIVDVWKDPKLRKIFRKTNIFYSPPPPTGGGGGARQEMLVFRKFWRTYLANDPTRFIYFI